MERDADELPLLPDELAHISGLPAAFIRLAIECGCPVEEGRVSHSEIISWLSDHYNEFRAATGLPVLHPSQSVDPVERARVKFKHSLGTILDYRESRSSDPLSK